MRTYYDTKMVGYLALTLNERGQVTAAAFVDRPGKERTIPKALTGALDAYFKHGTTIPKSLYQFPKDGTDFRQAIWKTIATVPAGKIITYTELAAKSGRPTAVRAAGTACGKNPLALFIPCHRVVRSSGEDFRYAWGTARKRALLKHEQAI